MHSQEIISSHITIESASNTPFDSTTDLINDTESSSQTSSNIHHPLTITNDSTSFSKESSSNPEKDQNTTYDPLPSQPHDNLINLSGWSVVTSWKNENFQMNEHQNAYLEKM